MIALPMGPAPSNDDPVICQERAQDKQGSNAEYDQFNIKKDIKFTDEVKIGDQTLFTIDHEHILNEDDEKLKRKSKWGPRPERKKVYHKAVTFDPFEMLRKGVKNGPAAILADGQNDKSQYQQPEKVEKKSKWGDPSEKTFHPPLLHHIPSQLNQDDLEFLIRCYRLDEMNNTQEYQQETIFDDQDCRSPSPPPEYDQKGKRVNTREHREKENFKKEKNDIIEECMKIKSNFVPPRDYRPPRKSVKVFIPEPKFGRENNFIGKIIGPQGSTQKKLEAESGCKISLRGKGSSTNKRTEMAPDEKLHVFLQADTDEQVQLGQELVMKILAEDPSENNQVSILQTVHSFLSSDVCENCHELGHKTWQCTQPSKKTKVRCQYCNEQSHVSMDCPDKKFHEERILKEAAFKQQQEQLGYSQQELQQSDQFKQFISQIEGEELGGKLMEKYQKPMLNPAALQQQKKERQKITETTFITDDVRSSQIRQITATEGDVSLFGEDAYKKRRLNLNMEEEEQDINLPKIPIPQAGETFETNQNIIKPGLLHPYQPQQPGQLYNNNKNQKK